MSCDPPGVVVPAADPDGVPEAGECSVQLLRQNKLVAQQGVGVGKAGVHLWRGQRSGLPLGLSSTPRPLQDTDLDGSLEEFDGHVVLTLQTEAVPSDTPGLEESHESVKKLKPVSVQVSESVSQSVDSLQDSLSADH